MKVWRSLSEGKAATFMRAYPKTSGVLAAIGIPAMAIVAALGGFAEGEAGPPKLAPGKTIEAMPFELTVVDAAVSPTQPGMELKRPGRLYVRVRMKVRSLADGPLQRIDLAEAVRWEAMAKEREKLNLATAFEKAEKGELETTDISRFAYRVDDNNFFSGLNPGIATDVYLVWEIAAKDAPKDLTLTVYDHTFADVTNMQEENRWLRGSPIGEVTLPVRTLPARKATGR